MPTPVQAGSTTIVSQKSPSRFVATRDRDEYRRVRKRGWGDLF